MNEIISFDAKMSAGSRVCWKKRAAENFDILLQAQLRISGLVELSEIAQPHWP